MKNYLIFFILILGPYSINAEGIKLTCEPQKSSCLNCQNYQTLFPIEEFSNEFGSLEIEADNSEILNKTYYLSGDVIVKSDDNVLSADEINVNSANGTTTARGNVQFQDQDYLVTTNELTANKVGEILTATATNANYQDYSSGIGGANGYTKFISKTDSSVLLTNATYSLCPINKNDWLIDAEEIELNFDKNRGFASKATVVFYGVPIFYAPKYSFVLEGRGSGFLAPDINRYKESGKTKNEFGYRVPYYFNIAPDQDLLVALNYMSSRGITYEGKYRKLIAPKKSPEDEDSIWSAEVKYLQKDKITNSKRWLLNFSEEIDLSNKIHISALYHRVSDSSYFEEITRTDVSESRLDSHLRITYDDIIDNGLKLEVVTENEQVVNLGTPNYTRAFEASIFKSFAQSKTKPKVKFDFIGTKFAHDTPGNKTGLRSYGNIEISRKINKSSIPVITPKASVSLTNYSLKNNPNKKRTILGSGVDIDFTVFNNGKLFGKEIKNRISPIISYSYRQKKAQADIPIFDTTDKYDSIITFEKLKSGKRYTGFDRISNANDITLSLESSYRDKDGYEDSEKKDLLNIRIAQSYYNDKEVVSNTAETNYETRKSYSDIAASIDLAIGNYIINSDIQYNPKTSKIAKKEYSLSYQATPRKLITLSLKDEGTLKKVVRKISGAYPLTDSVHLFGGISKTTSTGIINNETIGLAYESCCWAFRIAHFKDANSIGGHNYTTGMELVLNGLGSTSSPLKGKIEHNVRGYISHLNFD